MTSLPEAPCPVLLVYRPSTKEKYSYLSQFRGSNLTVLDTHVPFQIGEFVALLSDTSEYLAATHNYAISTTYAQLWYIGNRTLDNQIALKHIATGQYLSANGESVSVGNA